MLLGTTFCCCSVCTSSRGSDDQTGDHTPRFSQSGMVIGFGYVDAPAVHRVPDSARRSILAMQERTVEAAGSAELNRFALAFSAIAVVYLVARSSSRLSLAGFRWRSGRSLSARRRRRKWRASRLPCSRSQRSFSSWARYRRRRRTPASATTGLPRQGF